MARQRVTVLMLLLVAAPLWASASRAESVPEAMSTSAPASTPGSIQLGCLSETGSGGLCADGVALDGATALALSPDGENAYVASRRSGAIAVFDRDADTGLMSQKPLPSGCVGMATDGCSEGWMPGVNGVVVSPDGAHVYATAHTAGEPAFVDVGTVYILERDPGTGELTPVGCVRGGGTGCGASARIRAVSGVAISPDGTSVYVASSGSGYSAIEVLDRNAATGGLSSHVGPTGCIDDGSVAGCTNAVGVNRPLDVAVAPDGNNVYVASQGKHAVAVFDRSADGGLTQKPGAAACVSDDGSEGACTDGRAMSGASALAVAPDGATVYVMSDFSDAVAVFARALGPGPSLGALTQRPGTAGCLSEDGAGGCADGAGLEGDAGFGAAVSSSGSNVYAVSRADNAFVLLARSQGSGDLAQPPAPFGCYSDGGSHPECTRGIGLDSAGAVAAAPVGSATDSVYVVSRDALAGFLVDVPLAVDGSIGGTVTEDGSGRPIEGARVVVHSTSFAPLRFASTDQQGDYVVDGLAPGDYRLVILAPPDHESEWYDDAGIASADLVSVTAGGLAVAEVALAPTRPTGSISGKVTNQSGGTPLEGALGVLLAANGTEVDSVVTDPSGNYLFSDLEPGGYRLIFLAPDGRYEFFDNSPVFGTSTVVNVTDHGEVADAAL